MRVIPTSWAPVILSRGTHHHHPSCSALLRAKWRRVFVSLRFNIRSLARSSNQIIEIRDAAGLVHFLMGQLGRPFADHPAKRVATVFQITLLAFIFFFLERDIYRRFNDIFTRDIRFTCQCAFIYLVLVRDGRELIFYFTEERIQCGSFVFYITTREA